MNKIVNIAIIFLSATSLPTTVMAGPGDMNQDPVVAVDMQAPIVDKKDTDNKNNQVNPINAYAAAGGVAVGAGLAGLTAAAAVRGEKVKAILREEARDETVDGYIKEGLLSANPAIRATFNKILDKSKRTPNEKKAIRDEPKIATAVTLEEIVKGRPTERGKKYRKEAPRTV